MSTITTSRSQQPGSSVPAVAETSVGLANWIVPITAMTFVLGAFIGLALKTENVVQREQLPSSRFSGLAEAYISMKQSLSDYQSTIQNLQKTNTLLNTQVTARDPQMKVLDDQLNNALFLAGLTDVAGPGIVITLNDSKERAPADLPDSLVPEIAANYLIHDVDIQRVLNELKAGGAEAFAVNNERVIGTTAVRCVGPAIQVNGDPIAPPYVIRAIGDPNTLYTVMNMQGGIADQLRRTDPAMITVAKADKLLLKGYDGGTAVRYAHPVLNTSAQSGQ